MSYGTFLSTVAVVALLAGVALLVVLSALTLAPLDKFGRRSVVPFLISLVAIWAGAVFTIYLQTISKLSRSAIIAGDPYRKRSRDVREPAPAEAPSHHLASTRRVVGDHRTDPPRTRSTKEHRSSSRRPACRSGRDHLQDEKRGPVERTAQGEFPDDSSVHRTFQRWVELGVLDLIWAQMIAECEELGGVNFEWQAADGAMGKARFGGTR